MVHHSEAFVALDTAKLRNAVAIADAGRNGEIRYLGEIDNTEIATRKRLVQLGQVHPTDVLLRGGPNWLWAPPADQESWPRLHGCGTVANSNKAW